MALVDAPRPPCHAYRVVEDILPNRYFLTQPPGEGIRLVIVGNDNIRSQWDMDLATATHLVAVLSSRPTGVRVVDRCRYTDRPKDVV